MPPPLHHPDTSPLPARATRRYSPPMEDLLIRPTTSQCAPIGSLPASVASVAGPGASRNRGGCFSRAQKLAPMRLYLGTKTAATITMPKSTWRGEKQPDRSPLPCRVAGDGSLRPTAPYARSTSVAPSDVRPSLGDQRLTMADACSHSRTAARSAPSRCRRPSRPWPGRVSHATEEVVSHGRKYWVRSVLYVGRIQTATIDDAEINLAGRETT